jgi:hypothetical protein
VQPKARFAGHPCPVQDGRGDPDPPRLVFDTDFVDTPGWSYAVSPDGQRLLVVKAAGPPINQGRISLIVNWQSALAKK